MWLCSVGQDFVKLFQHEGKVLRFKAKFANPKPEDHEKTQVSRGFLETSCSGASNAI